MVTMIHPTPTQASQNAFETAVLNQVEALHRQSAEPRWLVQRRQLALEQYLALGFPKPKSEAWQTVDVKQIASQSFEVVDPVNVPMLDDAQLLAVQHVLPDGLRLVFVNGIYVAAQSTVPTLSEGVRVGDIQSALTYPDQILEKYLGYSVRTTQDAFSALNGACFSNGPMVVIEAGVTLTQPIHIVMVNTDGLQPKSSFVRGLVVAESAAKADIVLHNVDFGVTPAFNSAVFDVVLDPDAVVTVTTVQQGGSETIGMLSTQAQLAENARLQVNSIAMGGRISRHQLVANLHGEGAHFENYCLNVLNQRDTGFVHSEIHHLVPRCTSEQLVKTILDGQSKSTFNGTILVHKDAQQTDAVQLNKNLLLSDNAVAYTRPQLQIDADDVKCAHGATVGQLNAEELFYLASRGIGPDVAQCLLTFGFAEELLDKIPVLPLRQYLEETVLARLGHQSSPLSCFAHCNTCTIDHAAALPAVT